LQLTTSTLLTLVLGMSALGWWFIAPVLVLSADPRLKTRSPDHASRLVRFYRVWGTIAIGLGAGLAWFLGGG